MKLKTTLFMLTIILASTVSAVPMTMNYQGQLESEGAPFDGIGLFKFAIVDDPHTPTVSYWSNNGSSVAGSQPTSSVAVSVENGLFHVLLGSADGMDSIPGDIFSNESLYLRIWFSNNGSDYQLLSPDQELVSVGFAFKAYDANTVDGMEGADLEESAEILAVVSAHTADASAHHEKTTSFSELTDSASDAQIPNNITLSLGSVQSAVSGDFHNLGGVDAVNDADSNPSNELQNLAGVLSRGNNAGGEDMTNLGDVTANSFSGNGSGLTGVDQNLSDVLTEGNNAGGADMNNLGTVNATAFNGNGSGLTDINMDLADVLAQGNDAGGIGMDNLGNIGIGIDSPSESLEVDGTVKAVKVTGPELEVIDWTAPALDQEIDDGTPNGGGAGDFWQSFTPEVTGKLTEISLYFTGTSGTLTLKLYAGQGVSGAQLYSGSHTLSTTISGQWVSISFPDPIDLVEDTVYTVAVVGNPFNSNYCDGNCYSRGRSDFYDGRDVYLRTYMIQPNGEPYFNVKEGDVVIESASSPALYLGTTASTGNHPSIHITGGRSANNAQLAEINFYNNESGDDGNANAQMLIEAGPHDNSSSIVFSTRTNTASALERALEIDQNGRVFVSNPDDVTETDGALNIGNSSEGLYFDANEIQCSHDLYINKENDGYIEINRGGGGVGIGANNPSYRLIVNGSAAKTDGIYWTIPSDARLKEILGTYTPGLETVLGLQPTLFNYSHDNPLNLASDIENVGFIAQDLQKILPKAVIQNEDGYLAVKSDRVFYAMINAIKTLNERIVQLEEALGVAEDALEVVETQNEALVDPSIDRDREMEILRKTIIELQERLDNAGL